MLTAQSATFVKKQFIYDITYGMQQDGIFEYYMRDEPLTHSTVT